MRNRSFGIEFEVTERIGNRELREALGQSIRSPATRLFDRVGASEVDDDVDAYAKSDGTTWDIKFDSSCGYEICTPALTTEDWPEVRDALANLWRAGARTSSECAAHVHLDLNDYTVDDLHRLVRVWSAVENALFDLVAGSRQDNGYCRSIGPAPRAGFPKGDRLEYWLEERGRYLCLNASEWWRHGRVEVRLHHGTLRYRDIRTWVDMLLALVEVVSTMNEDQTLRLELDASIDQRSAFRDLVLQCGSDNLYASLRDLVARRHPESVSLWPDLTPEFTAR